MLGTSSTTTYTWVGNMSLKSGSYMKNMYCTSLDFFPMVKQTLKKKAGSHHPHQSARTTHHHARVL
jgi:hypothetical protein